ncbi:MAG TPA: 50S ribosomal protein L31e [Methanobacteriaceae archaeon]|nr:50S ribosomal protein L31e [Methanobacteriaceae archaeon]
MERIYTIPLRDAKKVPRTQRSPRATRYVRDFIQRHMKSEDVKIDASVNEKIWERGIQKIPPKIKVKATKEDDGSVLVTLA